MLKPDGVQHISVTASKLQISDVSGYSVSVNWIQRGSEHNENEKSKKSHFDPSK